MFENPRVEDKKEIKKVVQDVPKVSADEVTNLTPATKESSSIPPLSK